MLIVQSERYFYTSSMHNCVESGNIHFSINMCINFCHRFGVGSGPVAVGEFICEGSESHLLRCLYKQGTDLGMIQECQSHSHDVGIICGEYGIIHRAFYILKLPILKNLLHTFFS